MEIVQYHVRGVSHVNKLLWNVWLWVDKTAAVSYSPLNLV